MAAIRGNLDEVKKYYKEVQKIDKEDERIFMEIGRTLVAVGSVDSSAEFFQFVLELHREDPERQQQIRELTGELATTTP